MYGPLIRPRYDRKVAGVCAAFARSYGWDPTTVRLILVLLVIFGGSGILAYVVCWIVIPEEPLGMSYPNPGQYPPPPPPANYPPQYQQQYPPVPPTEPPTAS
ncbi:PspC domain-containing protein [Terriglobus roseus]|uniref:Phage shock protein C (PspC) family protein n=1 Tax=Terriglobus roseus TaxID=392734 RepID=A0A1G7J515_9BACT|nr:PspC domain-containing protein [Terriglobus roseus]SDF19874.1 phage shock protein C (PspC) family protein [Terriglobus roseus]